MALLGKKKPKDVLGYTVTGLTRGRCAGCGRRISLKVNICNRPACSRKVGMEMD
ncbi:hypothetical protein AB0K15_18880 [Amycolatopsis sp. NPDC049253]|uniref:hypothetical protein n=1 Tax=Amycolatopsis sp. NPDC049253 TaxID=3155274 RepID=UPI003417A57B